MQEQLSNPRSPNTNTDTEEERNLVSAIINNPESIRDVITIVNKNDFLHKGCLSLYGVLAANFEAYKSTLEHERIEFLANKAKNIHGVEALIAELVAMDVVGSLATSRAIIVRNNSIKRKQCELGQQIYLGNIQPLQAISALEKIQSELLNINKDVNGFVSDKCPFGSDSIDILKPHGILGDIYNALSRSAFRDLPESYIAYGLHMLSLAAYKNKRLGVSGSKITLSTLVIAPSGAGKEHGQEKLKTAAVNLGISAHARPRSDKDLISNLVYSGGRVLYVIDEAHTMFETMEAKNAASYLQALEGELLNCATTSRYTLSGNHKREFKEIFKKALTVANKELESTETTEERKPFIKKDIERINEGIESIETGFVNPISNMALTSTPDKLDKSVRTSTVESGAIGRTLCLRGSESRSIANRKALEASLKGGKFASDTDDDFYLITEQIKQASNLKSRVILDDDCRTLLLEINDYYGSDKYINHPTLGALYNRLILNMYSTISALGIVRGHATKEDILYSLALWLQSTKTAEFLLIKDAAETGTIDHKRDYIKARILNAVGNKKVPRGKLKQNVSREKQTKKYISSYEESNTGDLFGEALTELIFEGRLIEDGVHYSQPK